MPSPTEAPTRVDLAIFVETADLPNPWYAGQSYQIPIHVTVSLNDVKAVEKISVPEQDVAYTIETGLIADGGESVLNPAIELSATGQATLTLSVKPVAGYTDIYPANNKVTIAIEVVSEP